MPESTAEQHALIGDHLLEQDAQLDQLGHRAPASPRLVLICTVAHEFFHTRFLLSVWTLLIQKPIVRLVLAIARCASALESTQIGSLSKSHTTSCGLLARHPVTQPAPDMPLRYVGGSLVGL